jgi:hypothetical protein
MAADGLDHTWRVTAIAVVAVARTWTHEEGGLSRRDRRLSVNHAKACANRSHQQEREGQFCDSSHPHIADLDLNLGPKLRTIKDFSNTISAVWL